MDHVEWNAGLSGHGVGLVDVDVKTPTRPPKLSASFFREAAMRKAVL
jgi:hypothetical protein